MGLTAGQSALPGVSERGIPGSAEALPRKTSLREAGGKEMGRCH